MLSQQKRSGCIPYPAAIGDLDRCSHFSYIFVHRVFFRLAESYYSSTHPHPSDKSGDRSRPVKLALCCATTLNLCRFRECGRKSLNHYMMRKNAMLHQQVATYAFWNTKYTVSMTLYSWEIHGDYNHEFYLDIAHANTCIWPGRLNLVKRLVQIFPRSPIQALKRLLNFQHLWTGLVGSCHPEHPNLNLHKCNLYWNPSQLVGLDMPWGLDDQTQIYHFFLGPSRISQEMLSTHACLLEHLAKGWDQKQHTEWSIPIQKKHFA